MNMQVLPNPTMVGSYAQIWRLRSVLLFCAFFLSTINSDSHREFRMGSNDHRRFSSKLTLCPCFFFAAYSDLAINDKLTLPDNNLPKILCTISSKLIRLSLQCLHKILLVPIFYILPILMPSSLLYLPSMTSMRYLLNIFQQRVYFCHLFFT